MIKEYYIIDNNVATGPYDVVMLVRKLRNGALTPETILSHGNAGERKPASEWPDLSEFFQDRKEERIDTVKHAQMQNRSLITTLKSGWHFLQNNQISTIFSGVWVLVAIILTGAAYAFIPAPLVLFGYIGAFVFSYFFLSCYLLCMLRMTRGQPVDFFYFKDKIVPSIGHLGLCSVAISLPALIGIGLMTASDSAILSMIGLTIFAIPGLLTFTLYTYSPLLILDQGYGVKDALKTSLNAVMKSGLENIGVLFALYVINFIGAMLALLPLALTLPITMSTITENYDELFS